MIYSHGKQEIKFGVDVPDISRRGFDDYRYFGGLYSFASLEGYASGNPHSYTVQQGNGHVTFVEKVLSGFLEDNVRLRPNLSVAIGVRYYWQNYFHDIPYNFAPGRVLPILLARKAEPSSVLEPVCSMTGQVPARSLICSTSMAITL